MRNWVYVRFKKVQVPGFYNGVNFTHGDKTPDYLS